MSLWNAVCSVLLCKSVRNRTHPLDEITHKQLAAEFFSHRTHRFNRTHLRTVSIPQKASGIQNTQNVTANEDTNKEAKSSLHPVHRGISVITPLPFGGGVGGGAAIFLPFVCSVLLCSSVRKRKHLRVVDRFFSHRAHRVH